MAAMKKIVTLFLVFLILIVGVFIFVNYYSFLFARKVKGTIVRVERIDMNVAMMQAEANAAVNTRFHSFAVAIKEDTGEIVTSSAEDRQWAVAQEGQCAEAVYYPYPPWQLDKSNTYFGARLEKLTDCQNP